ncbi:MAG: hypothetical protein WCA81_18145 [Rhizomicrobium sp.]
MIEQLIHHPTLPLAFSFEDDGRVAWGYLHRDGGVVADVWLYNRAETPLKPEWPNRNATPYRNTAKYSKTLLEFELPVTEDEISVEWIENADGVPGARILLNSQMIGELFVGDMPGRSLMAALDGPCARTLVVS